jgi:hypothetical protein
MVLVDLQTRLFSALSRTFKNKSMSCIRLLPTLLSGLLPSVRAEKKTCRFLSRRGFRLGLTGNRYKVVAAGNPGSSLE